MRNKLFLGLLISFFTFVLFTQKNLLVVNASSCSECTQNELCEYHKTDVVINQNTGDTNENNTNGNPIEIVDDENDEGITLLGNEEEDNVNTNGKPIEIVDDDNDEGITLLGNEEEDNVNTNGKPIEIVDDDNDEGITLLGDGILNEETN